MAKISFETTRRNADVMKCTREVKLNRGEWTADLLKLLFTHSFFFSVVAECVLVNFCMLIHCKVLLFRVDTLMRGDDLNL